GRASAATCRTDWAPPAGAWCATASGEACADSADGALQPPAGASTGPSTSPGRVLRPIATIVRHDRPAGAPGGGPIRPEPSAWSVRGVGRHAADGEDPRGHAARRHEEADRAAPELQVGPQLQQQADAGAGQVPDT